MVRDAAHHAVLADTVLGPRAAWYGLPWDGWLPPFLLGGCAWPGVFVRLFVCLFVCWRVIGAVNAFATSQWPAGGCAG